MKKKTIQIGLTFLGIALIMLTYIVYPKLTEKIEVTQKEKHEKIEGKEEDKNTRFTNAEYKGFTNDGSPYLVASEIAEMDPDNSDIIYMKLITATYNYKDGRTVIITSNEGVFNKVSGDIRFREKVKMIDSEDNKLLANNLDMLVSKDYAAAYNQVKISTQNGQFLIADKIKFDAIKKTFRISMLDNNEQIKVKLIK